MTLRRPLPSRLFGPRVTLSSRRGRRTVAVEIPPKQVIRAVLLTCGVLLVLLVLWVAQEVLFLLLLAILLATAIEPLVERLARGPFSRGVGILVVYTAIVLAIAVPAYAALPSLLTQSGAFLQDLPGRLDTLRSYVAAAPRPIQQAAETAIASGGQAAAAPPASTAEQLF